MRPATPYSSETQDTYGYVTNGAEEFKLARALTSHLYDLENRLVISSALARYDGDERKLADTNLEKLATLMPSASQVQNLGLFCPQMEGKPFEQVLEIEAQAL